MNLLCMTFESFYSDLKVIVIWPQSIKHFSIMNGWKHVFHSYVKRKHLRSIIYNYDVVHDLLTIDKTWV